MKRGTSGLNLILGVNKPAGMTSHDVVGRVRRAIGERRVGHAGTLDPAATGVLVVGVGQGTRLMGQLTVEQKSYLATISFGAETTTDDAEGEVLRSVKVDADALLDESYARGILEGILGKQMQVPPVYSAITVEGKRSYARARSGEQFELEPRPIEVHAADLIAVERAGETVSWTCAFVVSKGTYVRAIARDIGRMANSAAHLSRLCRTASGGVTLRDCMSLEELSEVGPSGAMRHALDPVRLLGYDRRNLTASEFERVKNGSAISMGSIGAHDGASVCMVSNELLWGVWHVDKGRLRPSVNFPQGIMGVRP